MKPLTIHIALVFILVSLPNGAAQLPNTYNNGADYTGNGHDFANVMTLQQGFSTRYGYRTTSNGVINNSQSVFGTNNLGSVSWLMVVKNPTTSERISNTGATCIHDATSSNSNTAFTFGFELTAPVGYCHSTTVAADPVQLTSSSPPPGLGFQSLLLVRDIDANSIKIWRNGLLAGSTIYDSDEDPFTTTSDTITLRAGAGIYELRVWAYAVSEDFAKQITGSTLAYWQSLEGSEEGAWFFEPELYEQTDWSIYAAQGNPANGALASTSFSIAGSHSYISTGTRTGVWIISATYTAGSLVAAAQSYQFVVDGSNIPGCTWSVSRNVADITESNFLVRCAAPATSILDGTRTVSITTSGASIVTASRIDVTLDLSETVYISDYRLYGLQEQIKSIENDVNMVYTNLLINSTFSYQNNQANVTHTHLDSHFGYTNGLINATEMTLIGNISVNNTELETLIHEADSQIGLSIYAIVWLIVMTALVVWAEKTKNLYIYALAIIAGMTFTVILWDGIAALRVLTIGAALLTALRAFDVYKNSDDVED